MGRAPRAASRVVAARRVVIGQSTRTALGQERPVRLILRRTLKRLLFFETHLTQYSASIPMPTLSLNGKTGC